MSLEKRLEAAQQARAKRELMLGQIELQRQLNEDDEARDYAAEEVTNLLLLIFVQKSERGFWDR